MNQKPLNPNLLNIDLLIPDRGLFKKMNLGEVLNTSIFEPSSDSFNLKGLFSPVIFGELGSDERLERLGYVDFKLPVFHPLVYMTICDLGSKYENILSGKVRARFDNKLKDFIVVSDNEEGNTGFHFFTQHVDELVYAENESHKRSFKKMLAEKYGKTSGLFSEWLILPAGLRDYIVDNKGVPSEDEVNQLYRSLINLANRLKLINLDSNVDLYDSIRFRLQKILVDIFKHFKTLIDGKHKFIQSKWATRGLNNSTRNVITSIPVYQDKLTIPYQKVGGSSLGYNGVVVGLFQYLKSLGNLVQHQVLKLFISRIVEQGTTNVLLFNPKEFKFQYQQSSEKLRKDWTTVDGINSIVNKLKQQEILNSPIKVDGSYLCLVEEFNENIYIHFNLETIQNPFYQINSNGEFTPEAKKELQKVFNDFNKGNVYNASLRPITYVELFYISIVELIPKYPAFVVRYPITGAGSIYPCWPNVKTTGTSFRTSVMMGLGPIDCDSYPYLGQGYIRSMTVHYSHLGKLGGDHDGDVLSFFLVFTDESINEVKKLLGSNDYYLEPTGSLSYSVSNFVLDSLLLTMTE